MANEFDKGYLLGNYRLLTDESFNKTEPLSFVIKRL